MAGNDDRPKLTYAERDKLRREGGHGPGGARPKGRYAEARAERAQQEYVKELDKLFTSEKGGAEGESYATAVREAHGSSDLATACRAYLDNVGTPEDPALASCFLDSGESDLVVAALDALLAVQAAGGLEVSSGLRSQLRMLAQGFDNDAADRAEELLEGL